MTPRYVTGLGIACALGTGAETFFRGLAGASRLSALPPSAITSFDVSKYPDARIVEVPGFDPTKYLGDKGLARSTGSRSCSWWRRASACTTPG